MEGSGSQHAIETDGREGTDDGGDGVDLWHLTVRIEERNDQKASKTAGQGPQEDLDGDV